MTKNNLECNVNVSLRKNFIGIIQVSSVNSDRIKENQRNKFYRNTQLNDISPILVWMSMI